MEISADIKIKPMGVKLSILFFGIPSLVLCFSVYFVMQKLHHNGVDNFLNFCITMIAPMALMLIAALIAYKIEGNRFNWADFSTRYRLKKMTKKDWIYTLVLFFLMGLIYATLSFTSKWLIQFKLFSPPDFLLPAVDPRLEQKFLIDTFMGVPLKGQWWIAVIYFAFLLFNILGEELWWRGYILPRQEVAFHKWTWLIHGMFWGLFHIFWKWNLIILIPTSLALSYVVSKRKNTYIGIIAHMANNSVPLAGIVIGIIGK